MKKLIMILSVTCLFFLCGPIVMAQVDFCEGDFDGDGDQDGSDAALFKSDFGRSSMSRPCPPTEGCPIYLTSCGSECVDIATDESNCGGCGNVCQEGLLCLTGECRLPYTCGGTLSPMGRWCDQGDGTVRDMTSGLLWLKNVTWYDNDLISLYYKSQAIALAASLYAGMPGAELSDGSVAGDWRLPTAGEFVHITTGTEPVYRYSWPQQNLFDGLSNWKWTSTDHNWTAIALTGFNPPGCWRLSSDPCYVGLTYNEYFITDYFVDTMYTACYSEPTRDGYFITPGGFDILAIHLDMQLLLDPEVCSAYEVLQQQGQIRWRLMDEIYSYAALFARVPGWWAGVWPVRETP